MSTKINILTLVTTLFLFSLPASQAMAEVSKKKFKKNEDRALYSYEIQEHTNNERVAVGDDFKVLRWKASNKNDQRWVFHRLLTGKYRIESLRDNAGKNKWLGVGHDGRLVLWNKLENGTQEFDIK